MSTKGKKKETGISLRTVNIWLIIGAIIISGLMFYSTYDLFSSYRRLVSASNEHIELRKDARELMDASDYLTEKVQRFTVDGDIKYLNDYFSEAFEEHHRENAITKLSKRTDNKKAVKNLEKALENSVDLMNREYYAMKLVIEAKGYKDYPELLQKIEISAEDKALSANDKMYLATKMVLDEEYYNKKDIIRLNMQQCLDELEKTAISTDESALTSLSRELTFLRLVIIIQTIGMVFLVWLTARLGIYPILKAVDQIKANRFIKESGAREFRYLIKAYNNMYAHYKKSLEKLNFKAIHDELTGAYNRAGYQSLIAGLDLSQTCMILFDVDNFKNINDDYGHEEGDKVITLVSRTIQELFSNEKLYRIGGDEFVVIGKNPDYSERISDLKAKLKSSRAEIGDLPASVSAGFSVYDRNTDKEYSDVFSRADKLMYEDKKKFYQTHEDRRKTR